MSPSVISPLSSSSKRRLRICYCSIVRGSSADTFSTLLVPFLTKIGISFLGEEVEMKSKNLDSSFCLIRSVLIL